MAVPPAIRHVVLADTGPGSLSKAHSWAAKGYGRAKVSAPRTYNEVRPLLEFGHHMTRSGQADAGVDQVLAAAELLIDWGYSELALGEIRAVIGELRDESNMARCEVQMGKSFDQRGQLDDALRHFEKAVGLSERTGNQRTLAEALFWRGRVHNARSDFEAAEGDLQRSVDLCVELSLGQPEPQARLALAWARKEQGAANDAVLEDFRKVLQLAQSAQDWATASGAHRELGFFLWVRFRQREAAEAHYSAALKVAEDHSLAKEVSAVHKDMVYLASEWGEPDLARQHLQEGTEAVGLLQNAYMSPGLKTNHALVLEISGDLEGARKLLNEGATGFAEQNNPGGEVYALRELARLEEELGFRSDAAAHLKRAREHR